jgi:5'-deoxynucleotidase YfbR-like HD superfamily hydrolase
LSLPSRFIAQGIAKEKQGAKEVLQDMIEKLSPEEKERVREKVEQLRRLTPEERDAIRGENAQIVSAIKDLEDVIAYLEAAPHDFGGHRRKALDASKEAVKQLRKAIAYKAKQERKQEKKND